MDAKATESWLFALLLLQTTSGFLGKGNYGIVRMNGGFASRCVAGWARSLMPAPRFIDDVNALREMRTSACGGARYAQRAIVLTWLLPWNREGHQFQVTQMEPWFIEAARPIRLRLHADGSLFALGATSKARQIGPKTVDNGDVGDPWTPINTGDKKKGRSALTLTGDGFTPQRVTDLLFEQGFELTQLQKPQPGDTPGWFVASCLVRGQGTTEGFHRAEILVPAKARMALLNRETRDTLAHLAQKLLSDAKTVQNALITALMVLTKGDPDKMDSERAESRVKVVSLQFGKQWEQLYLPTLWRGVEDLHDTVRADWQQRLVDSGQALIVEANMRLPSPSNRYWRTLTKSQSIWRGRLNKSGLPMPSRVAIKPIEIQERPT